MRNSKTFVVFPSANPPRAAETVAKWRMMGYQTAVMFDYGMSENAGAHLTWFGKYEGYWNACNWMANILVNGYERASIVIFAADDIEPDPNHSCAEISDQFICHFPDLFGVMQPCGDKQGVDHTGRPAAARICGSPWLGAEWIKRAYGGTGAMNAAYFHFYSDQEIKVVAERLGVLWTRPDLTQHHHHWSFEARQPASYQQRNSSQHWESDKKLYYAREKAGFPESDPLGKK